MERIEETMHTPGDEYWNAPKRRVSVGMKLLIALGCLGVVYLVITNFVVSWYTVPTSAMENAIMAGDFVFATKWGSEPERGGVYVFRFPGNRDQVSPDQPYQYLKRCVAVAGDRLEIRNGAVVINGQQQQHPPSVTFVEFITPIDDSERTFPPGMGFTHKNWGPLRVPARGDVIELDASNFRQWRTFIMREGHTAELDGATVNIDGRPTNGYVVECDYWFGMGDNRTQSFDSRYWGFIPYQSMIGTVLFVE